MVSAPVQLVAFDLGHTLLNERVNRHLPIEAAPIELMPGALAAVSSLGLPLAVWANTRIATEKEVRTWLERAGLGPFVRSVATSVDAGARKPSARFFSYALARAGVTKEDVLFVGNQLNTDVAGGQAFGIRTVWLSGDAYRSEDDAPCDVTPTYTIDTLDHLPALVGTLHRR